MSLAKGRQFALFDCFQAAKVLLLALFSVGGIGADCRQRESAGDDMVWELMRIMSED